MLVVRPESRSVRQKHRIKIQGLGGCACLQKAALKLFEARQKRSYSRSYAIRYVAPMSSILQPRYERRRSNTTNAHSTTLAAPFLVKNT